MHSLIAATLSMLRNEAWTLLLSTGVGAAVGVRAHAGALIEAGLVGA